MARISMSNLRVLQKIEVGTYYSEKRDTYYKLDWFLVCELDKDQNNPKNHRRLWKCDCASATFRGKENEKKNNSIMKAAGLEVPKDEKGQSSCIHLIRLYQAAKDGVIPSDYHITEAGMKLLGVQGAPIVPVEMIAEKVATIQQATFEQAVANKVGILSVIPIDKLAELVQKLNKAQHKEELRKAREFRKQQGG